MKGQLLLSWAWRNGFLASVQMLTGPMGTLEAFYLRGLGKVAQSDYIPISERL